MSVGYIKATFCSFAAWWLLYLSVFRFIPRASFRVNRKSSVEEFFCRIVTLIHAVLVVVLSISSVFINQTWPFREPGESCSSFKTDILTILRVSWREAYLLKIIDHEIVFLNLAGPNLAVQDGICILSVGYFLFDLSWCLYHKTEGEKMNKFVNTNETDRVMTTKIVHVH